MFALCLSLFLSFTLSRSLSQLHSALPPLLDRTGLWCRAKRAGLREQDEKQRDTVEPSQTDRRRRDGAMSSI